MADKLYLYNDALRRCKQRKLASLTENVEARRVLDDVYDEVLLWVLGEGFWKFARPTVEIDAEASGVDPAFGLEHAFVIPDDYVRLVGISASETMDPELRGFQQEGGYWFAAVDPLYVTYVSNDADYGLALDRFPPFYTDLICAELAFRASPRIGGTDSLEEKLERQRNKALTNARS